MSAAPRPAEEFLLNTALKRNDSEVAASVASYFNDVQVIVLSLRDVPRQLTPDDVLLPPPVGLEMSLGEALARRRSKRMYTGDSMTLEYLSTLLRAAAGTTATADAPLRSGGTAQVSFRTAPSAGGLYPLDVYVLPVNVRSLGVRLYRYVSNPPVLVPIGRPETPDAVLSAFATTENMISLSRCNAIFLLVARPWRVMRKYGQRGMRFVFMEVGSIAQNVNLAAVALGYGSVECASVYDDEMNEAIGVDGMYGAHVHTVVVGYSA
jgi:SagB-type dehydrogenase family enzyme